MSAPKIAPVITVESPFPVEELPRVWLWIQESPHALMNNLGPQTIEEFVDYWMERKAVTWGVYRDGILGGWIVYEPTNRVTGNAHCVFKKGEGRHDSFFGHKTTVPALSLAFDEMFSIGVQRIGMLVFQSNRAVQSLIKALGGELEAIHFNPRDDQGRLVLLNAQTEVQPMLQYGVYRDTFGTPNARGLTYGEWLKQAQAKET